MPMLGMAQETGVLVAWHKAPGDAVAVDDILMEVETDKSTVEVPAGFDGFVVELRATNGEEIAVGRVIAIIATDLSETIEPPASETEKQHAPEIPEPLPTPSRPDPKKEAHSGDMLLASPKVKRMAHEAGLDLSLLANANVPQPYVAAHIEQLRDLSAQPKQTAVRSSVTARIPGEPFAGFLQQLAEDTSADVPFSIVTAYFASKALRGTSGAARIVTELRDFSDTVTARFSDLDLSRPSHPVSALDEAPANLTIRDLSGSFITGLTASATATGPEFIVNNNGAHIDIAFNFSEDQISAYDALELTNEFATYLGSPLLALI